jgi:hypothetical protein
MDQQTREERTKRFESWYALLNSEMKDHISNLLVKIDECGEHHIGYTIFVGSEEIFDSILPCLFSLSSSLRYHNVDGMERVYRIEWQPSDFIIPDMILDDTASNTSTPIAGRALYDSYDDFESLEPLSRIASSEDL